MQYRTDKRTGNKLSVLGLGCMRFPKNFGVTDMRKTDELIMRAIEGGVNYFDSAWIYSGSEEALGLVLEKNNARKKVYIATKLPLVMLRSASDFDKYFSQQLARLRTDYIDYYLLHMLTDMDQWSKLKAWGMEKWIEGKKKSGQIRQIGFSFHGMRDEFLELIDDYDWEMCLMQYNYSDENYQAGVTGLRKASEKMPVMIMEPLLGGKLANLPKDAVDVFKRANPDISPAGWAFNWVWNQKEVTLLLSGMESTEQLEENMALADSANIGILGEKEKAVYADVLKIFNKSCKVRCTGCNYCMPCPKGVNIPGCFASYNTSYSVGYSRGMHQFILSSGFLSAQSASPGLCVKCGICETRCPQHLPIAKELANVRRRMEPFWMRLAGACARAFLGKKRKKTDVGN
jgi:predicted aldo/keto reductase-like oxidoreductase